jgi:TRAP-type transport system periplasmic protein
MSSLIARRKFTALAGTLLLPPGARAATSWQMATGYRSESFHTLNLLALAREVEAATRGELRIEVRANNSLVKLSEIRAAVQSGKVQAGETIMSSLVSDMPIAGADSVPFITTSFSDARRMWRYQRPLIERHFAGHGLTVLYAVPWPPQGLYSVRPIATLGDLKGARMRTYNATTARIAALLGAQTAEVAMPDVGKAFAEGRIDSMITSAVTGVENQVWNHARYYYEINAWFPKNIVFANTAAMNALSPAVREALLKASAQAEQRGWSASEEAASASVIELRKNGMKIERMSRESSAEIKRLGERLSLEWIRQVGSEANDIFIPYFTQQ